MIRRPPRSTQSRSSAASDVYKRQAFDETGTLVMGIRHPVLPIFGIQFHPESVGSPLGLDLISTFLKQKPILIDSISYESQVR